MDGIDRVLDAHNAAASESPPRFTNRLALNADSDGRAGAGWLGGDDRAVGEVLDPGVRISPCRTVTTAGKGTANELGLLTGAAALTPQFAGFASGVPCPPPMPARADG
jgi:hypothetical protein